MRRPALAGETLVAGGAGFLIREFLLAPGEATPWHSHNQVSDRCYGLLGAARLQSLDGLDAPLPPGAVAEVPARTIHRLVNPQAAPARVLLVQTGGRYDFRPAEGP